MSPPLPASALSCIHLLGHFGHLYTGAERELLDMKELFDKRRPAKLWSDVALHPGYAGRGIVTVQPFASQFPKDGVLLIAGVHIRPGIWLKYTKFERIIVFYNLASHAALFSMIEQVREATGLDPELVFVSAMLQTSVGLPGRIARSLMSLQPFWDVADKRLQLASLAPNLSGAQRRLVVGRASRDALDKHHPDDPSFYRMLASQGIQVRVMGGTCLAPALDEVEGVELLAAGAEPVTDFYQSLDIFFYRTGHSVEAYGRVVLEAMSSGLPVVAHSRGGYVEVIANGVDGFLFQSQEEAYDTLMALRASPLLCLGVGRAASQKAREIHGPQAIEQDINFYLR
jgi:hypothetical protein